MRAATSRSLQADGCVSPGGVRSVGEGGRGTLVNSPVPEAAARLARSAPRAAAVERRGRCAAPTRTPRPPAAPWPRLELVPRSGPEVRRPRLVCRV